VTIYQPRNTRVAATLVRETESYRVQIMSRIDYSKWDRFDDEDDNEDEPSDRNPVRVTRLDQPSTITINPSSDSKSCIDMTVAQPKSPPVQLSTLSPTFEPKPSLSLEQQQNLRLSQEAQKQLESLQKNTTATQSAHLSTLTIPASWTERGSTFPWDDRTIWWSQDRTSVTARLSLDAKETSREWQVHTPNALTYADRHCAVGTRDSECSLTVSWKGSHVVHLTLPHAVHYAYHETDEQDEVDWCIETIHNARYLVVTLYKATPMTGMTVWWSQLGRETPLVLTAELQPSSGMAFAEAWKEAHAEFQRKVQPTTKLSTPKSSSV
jgi:hypothetical protein